MTVSAVAFVLGCASGGGGDQIEIGYDSESSVTTDSQGFEKALGPAEKEYQVAKQLFMAGNYRDAITHLETSVSIKPTYLEAWSDLGKAYTELKDYEKGISAYEKASELSPGNEALIASIGYNYLYLENWDKAAEYYQVLVDNDSLNYSGNVNLAFIAQRKGDKRTAIEHYERALRANPGEATTMGTLASLYGDLGNKDKKYEYLHMAIEADPSNHQFKKQLSKAYFYEKEYEKSIPIFEELVMIYPDDPSFHQKLGFALSQTDRKAEAPAELEKALELSGGDAFTWAILAKIYNESKSYEKAIQAAKSGLALNSGEEEAFLNYQWGEALSKLGQYESAIVRFETAVALNDKVWSTSARKQVDRQHKLIKRREAEKEKELYE
jgi:tetratricopeptide (TPR) repeat protein